MANFNLNKVILGGRLTSDPELKQSTTGLSVTTFTLAINSRGKDGSQRSNYIDVIAWRQTAEFICRYFKKGSSICIIGSLSQRSWKGRDGLTYYKAEIVADEATFVDSKDSVGSSDGGEDQPSFSGGDVPKFEDLGKDEDLPF